MADSEKRESSSVTLKEKNSLLDLDIGKDFLSSWKSMSVAEGDVEFDLTPASKDNKKSFDFAKADMDFNLDGDFGKISSFNMDMSDLDISPPLKKDAQSKEKSKESTSGTKTDKRKTDRFAFAFDFDELENFNFEPSVTKEGSEARSNKNNKESSQNGTECQDKEGPMHMNQIKSTSTLENRSQKPSLPGIVNTFDMDCLLGGIVDFEPARKNYPSKLRTDDAITSEHSGAIDDVAFDKSKSHPETAIASRELPKINPSENLVSPDPIDHEAFTGNDDKQDLLSDGHPNNEPSGGNSSEAQLKVDSVNMSATGSNGEQDVDVASITGSTYNYKNTMPGNPQQLKIVAMSEKNKGETSQVGVNDDVIDKIERTELGQVNPLVETSCTINAASGMCCDTLSGRESRKPASEILKLPSVSRPADQSDKETENASEPPITCSRYLIQSEKPEYAVQKASIQTTFLSLSSKKMGFTQPTLVEGRRDSSIQSDRKLVSLPFQYSKMLLRRELPKTQSQDSCKGLKICGDASSADGLQNGEKQNDPSTTQKEDMVKEKSALRQREMSMKDLDILSSCAAIPCSSMKINKQAAHNHGNPTTLASIPTMRNTFAEEHRFSLIEGDRKAPELPGLKLPGLNLDPAKPTIRKDIKSVGNLGRNRVSLRETAFGFAPDSQKQAPSTLPMKRKTFKEDAGEVIALHPSKRLSQSPSASRNSVETTEKVLDNKVINHNKGEDDRVKSTIGNSHVSTVHIHDELTVKGMEISFSIENDNNIKRAEAYNKELDDLCNMLRKKQDEAKEILVRAAVNSNKLLLLNSPRLEEKIRATQKFFTRLTLNSVHG